jgi:hypothetical protein
MRLSNGTQVPADEMQVVVRTHPLPRGGTDFMTGDVSVAHGPTRYQDRVKTPKGVL